MKTMSQQIRVQVKNQIDAAITVGAQPKAPRGGLGLILPTGVRSRTLYDKNGITAAGKYYYDKTGIAPPGNFDYQQDATRKGRSQYIKLLGRKQKNKHMGQCEQRVEANIIGKNVLLKGSG
jgi:hypothetical protein